MATTQPLSVVCNVAVSVSPVAAATPTFNQGLIVGPSTVIPSSSGTNPRIRQYLSLAQMSADGFTTAHPEYVAAQLYFGQQPAPSILWVGRQDTTASETPLTALQACRAASPNWWACLVTSAVAADHLAIAAWIQGTTPQGMYFYTTADSAVLNNTAGNVMATMQSASYSRAFGVYSTTQTGAAPNNAYAAAAAMGTAMGLNTGLANSNFTMKFKQLSGVIAEPLTASQISTIQGLNGNLYLNTANVYNWLQNGTCPNGQFLDEVLQLDMLASDIQYSVANGLIAAPSIPQTNAGEVVLLGLVSGACERALSVPGRLVLQTISFRTASPQGYADLRRDLRSRLHALAHRRRVRTAVTRS